MKFIKNKFTKPKSMSYNKNYQNNHIIDYFKNQINNNNNKILIVKMSYKKEIIIKVGVGIYKIEGIV